MIFRQLLSCAPAPWKFAALALLMSALVTGLLAALFLLFGGRARSDSLSYSKAEPVRGTATFPFGRDRISNFSRSGVQTSLPPHPPSDLQCPEHHFPCRSSGACLPLDKRCDGTVDCPKAEDELHCVCAFRLPSAKFCDKYPDCFDESDESFCSYCPAGWFNCGDGKCIERTRVCDSAVDCENFMDENFCFRLSTDIASAGSDSSDPSDSSSGPVTKTGFLLRNKNGMWYPVCANPHDFMQDALSSYACVSITANPLSGSSHQCRSFDSEPYNREYIYHYHGRFVQWNGCLSNQGLFVTCEDVRCGFNPRHLLPSPPRGRIVGGNLSDPGAWPWHGAIYKNGSYACGSTLVSSRWLLSAAHCFLNYRSNYYEVQLGMLRRRSFTPHQKTYRIDRVVPHHKFNIVTLEFDIVMLRTAEPVAFDFWVRPICLPGSQETAEDTGSFCTAVGWGDTGEREDDSDDLQEVHVPITKYCRGPDRWICAGFPEGGRDACQGDSGGPLMCLQKDGISWYLAGIISAGTGCARPQTPGMYTRVAYFLEWVTNVMAFTGKFDPPLSSCPGWKCAALGGGRCIHPSLVCDGHVDCYDAQDEANCFGKLPNSDAGSKTFDLKKLLGSEYQ